MIGVDGCGDRDYIEDMETTPATKSTRSPNFVSIEIVSRKIETYGCVGVAVYTLRDDIGEEIVVDYQIGDSTLTAELAKLFCIDISEASSYFEIV